MDSWLINGEMGAAIRPDDRGFAYGDGLFETIALRSGAPRFLDRHLARLGEGCRRLGIPQPADQKCADEIRELIAGHQHGTIKLIVTRGTGPRGYRPPRPRGNVSATRVVTLAATEPPRPAGRSSGIQVIYCRTPLGCNPMLAGLKTLNRLENVLAQDEWEDPAIAEGLMLDTEGRVVCGTMTNLFLVHDGRLLTPGLARCGIRGVMRSLVLETARGLGLEFSESNIAPQDVGGADELFMTNALIGIWPVSGYADRRYNIGPVTRAIAAALGSRGVAECRW